MMARKKKNQKKLKKQNQKKKVRVRKKKRYHHKRKIRKILNLLMLRNWYKKYNQRRQRSDMSLTDQLPKRLKGK